MNLHWLDWTVIISYLVMLMGMGFYFSKKNKNTEEYFVGGRSYSGWVIGLSMVGTSISSVTFLAYPADGFKTAWLRFIPNFMLPIGIVVAAYMFLPFFRRTNTISAYEYLEHRFGPSVRLYGAITFILGQLIRLSMILFLLSLLMHEITGFSLVASVLLAGVFVSIYTIVGGIDAVIWTDVIQTIMLVLGGIVCLGIIINLLPGGLGQIFTVAIDDAKLSFSELIDGKLNPVSWGFSLTDKTGLMMLILGLSVWLQEYGTNQNIVQRYAAAKNIKEARKAMFVSMINVPIWAFYMFLGTALYVYFKVNPSIEAAEMLNGVRKAEQILPYFIINFLPVGISGLVIAAAGAAAMSSLDSSINAISTVGINDIYRRHLVKGREDKHYLHVAWVFATFASVFMIIGAIVLTKTETKTLQDTATILASVLMGGIFGLYLFGFITKRGDSRTVWIGILFTFLFSVWTIFAGGDLLPDWLSLPFDLYYTGFIGHIVMFTTIFIATLLLIERKKNLTNLTIWTQDKTPIEN
jgi:SSS family solute:Na+ symporter